MSKPTATHLWALLSARAQQHPEATAWIDWRTDAQRRTTYAQLYAHAHHTAAQLTARGVVPGASVGIFAPNCVEFAIAALAAWKVGASIAPIHTDNSDSDIKQQITALQLPLILAPQPSPKPAPKFGIGVGVLEVCLDATDTTSPPKTEPALNEDGDALAARIYTSGSTGNPKVVRLSHANLNSNVEAAVRLVAFTPRDRFIALLPLSHAMGLLANMLLPLYCGGAAVVPRSLAARDIMDTLQSENISVVIAVPKLYRNIMRGLEKRFAQTQGLGGIALATYRRLLRLTPPSLRQFINAPLRKKLAPAVKIWVSGGARLDPPISRYFHHLGLPLRQGYGLTETSPLVSVQAHFYPAHGSVGKPVAGVRVKIHRPDAHGQGEVWVRGANVMLGYEDRQQTAEVLRDGWFKSGDLGRLDSRGRLFLTGRAKRLIVTEAGKNVYPEELETHLERLPEVLEAGVLELELKPACVLAVETPADSRTQQSIRAALAEFNAQVSAHNRISRFALVEQLPRTPLGKIALTRLPEIFAEHEIR